MPKKQNALVCVTGASGYIGSHIVRELLERGYRVRATVRDISDEGKVGHLRNLVPDATDRLSLHRADLMVRGDFDRVIDGCDYVCHAASSVMLQAKDPQRQIIDISLEGTKNVFASIAKAKSVKRVVHTSSIAAITNHARRPNHLYTEADWASDLTIKNSPYGLSKVLAEREAWAAERDGQFSLVTINPVFVLGPIYSRVHARSSPSMIRDFLRRKMPGAPRLRMSMVDVRDVAAAHVNALENADASGRYILYNEGRWMKEVASLIKKRFPQYKVRARQLPDLFLYAGSLFDKRLSFSFLRSSLGRVSRIDGSKVSRELGIRYRPVEESIVDTCQSMIDLKLV